MRWAWLAWGLVACGGPSIEVDLTDGVRVLAPVAEGRSGRVDPGEGRALLQVRAEGAAAPLTGRWRAASGVVSWEPAVPLAPGAYVASLPGRDVTERFVVPAPAAPPPVVVREVWPQTEVVPANLLRVSVTFSGPMTPSDRAVDAVHLVDLSTGDEVHTAFQQTALWNGARDQLTLVVHPGRVKEGIAFAEGLGKVLLEGRRYRLELGDLTDAQGRSVAGTSRTFAVGPADHGFPEPATWDLSVPTASNPLHLRFDEPMEHTVSQHAFAVRTDGGEPVAGRFEATDRGVAFVPEVPWVPGAYRLERVGPVEDLAGNTPSRRFDGPPESARRDDPGPLAWRFEVGGAVARE